MAQKFAGDSLGCCAKVQDDRAVVGDGCGTGRADGGLGGLIRAAARFIALVGDTGAQDRPAMHTVHQAGIGQIRQVTADGLQGDSEFAGKLVNGDTAFVAGNFQNLTLPKTQYQPMAPLITWSR